ncbi:hypothetical protein [Actibacterium sp. 188UL27-1]|uniref:hypothetical protein n=1 Tax=Actibacterium sp. 188UL27-1 TaxID=2786961 RepID=UPI00195CC92A|nr:hypothetical protein [Actibacterium sp. 188UL27-1]MBM7068963.1 hypothetical protein [Actibacterium sp. 188UL27-1]
MAERDGLSLLTIITVIVATPATIALSIFVLTQDYSFRPLGITVDRLEVSQSGRPRLRAYVDVPDDQTSLSRVPDYARTIKAAFKGRGLDVPVEVRRQSGLDEMTITYRVGATEVGPFAARNASAGIHAATQAYWMQQEANGL